jgi:Flp pilus assembly CpaE family ATPase
LRILTGLSDPARWPELRASALETVLSLGRWLADVTVIDCGFSLEEDEELAYDTAAPRRNAATLASLSGADRVVAVGSADPVGLSRLIRDLPRLGDVLAATGDDSPDRIAVVANRLRAGLLPGDPQEQARQALARHAGAKLCATVPMDTVAADTAHGRGQLLSEAAPDSPLQIACAELAGNLMPPVSRRNDRARRGWRPALRGRHRGSAIER